VALVVISVPPRECAALPRFSAPERVSPLPSADCSVRRMLRLPDQRLDTRTHWRLVSCVGFDTTLLWRCLSPRASWTRSAAPSSSSGR
jgi:hypothetical protein